MSDQTVEEFSFAGAHCSGEDEAELSVRDLIDFSDEIGLTEIEIGSTP